MLETATGELRLGPGSIGRLEVSRAIRSKAFVGAVIGMAVGVVAGVVAGLSAHNDPDASAVVGGLFLGAIGAPVGALVGAGKRYDVWTQLYPAPPRRPIASATAGGSRIVLSFHLPLPR